jgi:4-hydroxy-3-polyprenylbenzoate decarboxylase
VDAAGVHPLLLAIGSERYTPFHERQPQEILTQANAILGFNQCSLAKYLLIVAGEDDPALNVREIPAFLRHALQRVDFRRDLHFQTATTIDTLDYSGEGLNRGSKLVLAAAGKPIRVLAEQLPKALMLPPGYSNPQVALPGILVLQAPPFQDYDHAQEQMRVLTTFLEQQPLASIAWIILGDAATFTASTLDNLLWVTFTRSNPSHDCYGVKSFVRHKHWGCEGPLIIDARSKPHHAPALEVDPAVEQRVDALCAPGKSLHGVLS